MYDSVNISIGTFVVILLLPFLFIATVQAQPGEKWVVYEGQAGPGQGKHIVFVTGDEEYRSEEAMPMLAQILAVRHGFKCTVLFALDPATGEINPDEQTNIPGLHLLDDADMMVLFTRFRELPDADMKHIIDFTNSGKPIVGLRTSTHPFNYTRDKDSPFARYDFRSTHPRGGYGEAVLGQTWVNHHGHHKVESTRGIVNGRAQDHPVLKGVQDVWGPTDVYGIPYLPDDAEVLLYGQVLVGMEPTDAPNFEKSVMPLVWTRHYVGETGRTTKVFATTMGASVDLESEDLRRVLVNGVYWGLDMEGQIPERSDVAYVGPYNPTFYGFGEYQRGMRPADFVLK